MYEWRVKARMVFCACADSYHPALVIRHRDTGHDIRYRSIAILNAMQSDSGFGVLGHGTDRYWNS